MLDRVGRGAVGLLGTRLPSSEVVNDISDGPLNTGLALPEVELEIALDGDAFSPSTAAFKAGSGIGVTFGAAIRIDVCVRDFGLVAGVVGGGLVGARCEGSGGKGISESSK
jgi:hypothetical protein